MTKTTPITVARGDGIGPEIMDATLKILTAANAKIEPQFVEIGEQSYLNGCTSGISEQAWETIRKNPVILKAPITTPQGGGYKSLNVTLRKALELNANVRGSRGFAPYVKTNNPEIDLVIIRENSEGLYAGIEYQQTEDSCQTLKLYTRQGCEKIIRYAFEYAKKYNRKKVTAMAKDNIMKLTDGLFHRVFDEVKVEYPDIVSDFLIIDIGTALLATNPERFDVVVTTNLYGDIISDVTAQVAGSVGLAGSANIGEQYAMFEAIHGSAPDIAGKQIANPSGLLNAAILMLVHLGDAQTANTIYNAWLKTLEDGLHTADIYSEEHSKQKVTTSEFADAVIARLGQTPAQFKIANFKESTDAKPITCKPRAAVEKTLVGVDVYIDRANEKLSALIEKITAVETPIPLSTISDLGFKVYPKRGPAKASHSNLICIRYQHSDGSKAAVGDVISLLSCLQNASLDFIKLENLYTFDNKPGFSLAQGQ